MSDRHLQHWPSGVPRSLDFPQTHLWANVAASAARHPDKPCLVFYDSVVTHGQFRQQTEWLAGWLQQVAGVQRGDRVLLCTQNSPQFAIGAYGVLRADAVLVPVNPMNRTEEIRHLVLDAGAKVLICAQDLFDQVAPLLEEGRRTGEGLQHVLVAAYTLRSVATGAPAKTGRVRVELTYDSADQPFASVAAQQDAQERAAAEAARRIQLELAAWFAEQPRP